jgi:hypothetical protein
MAGSMNIPWCDVPSSPTRPHPGERQPGRQRHRMLLRDPDIVEPLGEVVTEALQAGAGRHAGRDRADPRIGLGQPDELLDERLCKGLRLALRLGLGGEGLLGRVDEPEVDRWQGRPVERHGVLLGGGVAAALDRLDVDQHGGRDLERRLEGALELAEVVAVEHADVRDPDVLEEADLGPRPLEALLRPGKEVVRGLADHRDPGEGAAGRRLRLLVRARQAHLVQPRRESAHRRTDAHLVVVEDDEQRVLHVSQVVQRLHRQPGADGRVADAHCDPLAPRGIGLGSQVARGRQADADADTGSSMTAVEDVVLALAPAREAADAVDLAQRVEAVPAPGEQLVGVRLVTGVPHDPVARRVHDPVKGEGDLDRAERARQVAAGHLDGANHLLAQLPGESVQVLRAEVAEPRGIVNGLEQRQGWLVLVRSPGV